LGSACNLLFLYFFLMKKEEDFTAFVVYCARAWLHGALVIQEKTKRQNGRATSG